MDFYNKLPATPDAVSASTVLCRLIDSIGHRFFLATDGLTEKEFTFRPVESSMSMEELLNHIYRLLFWSYRCFNTEAKPNKTLQGLEAHRAAILQLCEDYRGFVKNYTAEELNAINIPLRRTNTNYSFWYLINGPLADALSHIGQINTWRRIAGNPCPRISPFTGEPY